MSVQKGRLRIVACAGCPAEFQCRRSSTRFCSRSCGARARDASTYGDRGVRKGTVPWNRGVKDPRPGYRHSAETKAAIGNAHRNNGRPRKTPENKLVRGSERYQAWRRAVFERDDYRCQGCGARSRKGVRVEIQAHHIKEFSLYPELRFDVSNGLTLCRPCHIETPSFGRQAAFFASASTIE